MRVRVGTPLGTTTLLEALEQVLSLSRYQAILDSDRLRVVPWEEALDFWMHWGAVEGYR